MNTRLSSFEGFPFFPPSVTLSFAVPVQVFSLHIWPLLPLFFFFFFLPLTAVMETVRPTEFCCCCARRCKVTQSLRH